MNVNDFSKILEEKPTEPYRKYIFKHPEWWRYDQLIESCFFKVKETQAWSINEIRKRRKLLNYGLISIEMSDGRIFTSDDNYEKNKLLKKFGNNNDEIMNDEEGEILSVYYSEKILLSIEEEQKIEKDLEIYNDDNKITKLKPPFNKMIIEMDIARRIGGYSRNDIMEMSKKDMDTIYLLHRLGLQLPIKEYIKSIENMNNSNEQDNSEKLANSFDGDLRRINEIKRAKIIQNLEQKNIKENIKENINE